MQRVCEPAAQSSPDFLETNPIPRINYIIHFRCYNTSHKSFKKTRLGYTSVVTSRGLITTRRLFSTCVSRRLVRIPFFPIFFFSHRCLILFSVSANLIQLSLSVKSPLCRCISLPYRVVCCTLHISKLSVISINILYDTSIFCL